MQTNHPSRATSQNSSSTRDRRAAKCLIADQSSHSTASDERHGPAPTPVHSSGSVAVREPGGAPRRLEASLSSPSDAWAVRRSEYPASQIPRVVGVGGSSSSLQSRGSPCRSSLSSDSDRTPAPGPRPPPSSTASSFAGRLGQPPRGPLSLHMYSRKNVFLQHSLHTAELQALAQHDG
ncbi:hypothetical protein UPYG_G00189830 [Umbra pygmaea]|uniref:Uncharacterized protein n=1 Tax=Umbra pygmaea TaxID=75934 RepID=A0ABD0XB49_UMBPY